MKKMLYLRCKNNHFFLFMGNRTKGRILIPSNLIEHLQLAKKVYDKHNADGTSSPLNSLVDMNWEIIGPKIQECLDKHTEAEMYKQKMEAAYAERDKYLPEISEILRASKNLLKGIYAKNPKLLGNWGFEIDDSPKNRRNIKKDL